MHNNFEGPAPVNEHNPADEFIRKSEGEIASDEASVKDNLSKRDALVADMASALNMPLPELQSKLANTQGWPLENKSASWYKPGALTAEQEKEFSDLERSTTELDKNNLKLQNKIKSKQSAISMIEDGKSQEGKSKIMKNMKKPREYSEMHHSADLLEAGIITEDEIVECLNVRVSEIFSAYETGTNETWLGPRGDTPQYEAWLELQHLPESVAESVAASPKASRELVQSISAKPE